MERLLAPRRYLVIVCGLALLTSFVYRTILAPHVLAVTVIPVGKGTAVLVRTPRGTTFLIDTGPDAGIVRALGTALPEWDRRIDAVALTSMTAETAGGAPEVLGRYVVGYLIRPAARGSRSVEAALAGAAGTAPDLRQVVATRGTRITLGDGVVADVLWPDRALPSTAPADGALALRISYGATSFLVEDDLSPRAAAWLATLDADLLQTDVAIASTTPVGTYVSDGVSVVAQD
ncbi:MAG TPA: hypothetical protein VMV50_02450 [Candidatus Paceibacterota bacterium]|nr:hypothetical protein [Candidatus Paceibacterota bacterium]